MKSVCGFTMQVFVVHNINIKYPPASKETQAVIPTILDSMIYIIRSMKMTLSHQSPLWQSVKMTNWSLVRSACYWLSYMSCLAALQLTQLDIYNKVLIERQQRKKYVTCAVCVHVCDVLLCPHSIARQHNLIAGKQRQSCKFNAQRTVQQCHYLLHCFHKDSSDCSACSPQCHL